MNENLDAASMLKLLQRHGVIERRMVSCLNRYSLTAKGEMVLKEMTITDAERDAIEAGDGE